jgi:RHS repeat-associated protein
VASSLNPKAVSYGFQGSFSEEVNDFELNYNEFGLRTYDPQIGRWTTPDPYDEFPLLTPTWVMIRPIM